MTASATLLAALAASDLSLEAQACLAALAENEGAWSTITNPFNILYSGGTIVGGSANVTVEGGLRYWTGDQSAFPAWGGATTVGGRISTAAGAWQDTGTTWRENIAAAGVTDFTSQSQIKLNWYLAQTRFRASAGTDLLSQLQAGMLTTVQANLVKTWPGGADSGFAKRYANNMTALKTPAPPPLPPGPPPVTQPIEVSLEATDAKGNPVTIILKASAIALAIGIGMSLTCCDTPRVQIARAPSVFDTSTFYLDQNLHPIPLRGQSQ